LAIAEQDRDVAVFVVGRHKVEFAVAIDVADFEGVRVRTFAGVSRGKGRAGRGRERAIAASEQNDHFLAIVM